ncbi:MAG: M56 family metallopeptidase, partial [Acidobacteriaceae bacterium]
ARCLTAFTLPRVDLLAAPHIAGPLTVGVRSPAILVPAGFLDRCTPSEFLAAIGHECAHIRRRDYAKNLLCEILTLPIAFHPVAWLLKAQLAQTREMICDAATAGKLLDPSRYAESLLRLAAVMLAVPRAAQLHAIGIFDGNILEKRIMLIQTKRPVLSLAARCALVLPGALLLCGAAVAGAAMTTAVAIQAPSQPAQAAPLGHVYKIGNGVTEPVLTFAPDPEFPKTAFKEKVHFQGVCVVGVVVDKDGLPRDVHVVRSLRPDFDKNAMLAVRQYRFKPGTLHGKPVAVAIQIEVNFRWY